MKRARESQPDAGQALIYDLVRDEPSHASARMADGPPRSAVNLFLVDAWSNLSAKRRLRLRVTALAGIEYVATCTFLWIYWCLGKMGGPTVAGFFFYSLAANVVVLALIGSGVSERLKDPSLTAVQMVVSCTRDLVGCLLIPGLWFIFAFNLFIALPFGSLQFTNRSFAGFWLLTCTALGLIFLGFPRHLQIGFDSPVEKLVLWLFISAALGRLMIFNARISALRRKLRARGADLAFASRQLERERIARDLHDTLLQSVYSLVWRLEGISLGLSSTDPVKGKLQSALNSADKLLAAGRDQLSALRTKSTTERASLRASLRRAGDDLALHSNIEFHVCAPEDSEPEPMMDEPTRSGIERILLEALSNAFRHSEGRNVWLELTFGPEQLRARIRDDGLGIDRILLEEGRPGHFGIAIMRERASEIGAALTIALPATGGTLVTCDLVRRMNVPRGRLRLPASRRDAAA